jgi:hypothetical protein
LLLAFICSGVLSSITFLVIKSGVTVGIIDSLAFIVLFLVSALLSFISIFLYRSRQTQFVLGRLNIILNFILLGLFIFRLLNSSLVINGSEKGFGLILPVFSIVLLVLANKAIKKDEYLVKSVDRLR